MSALHYGRIEALATAQRAEIHVGLSDEALTRLATRAEIGVGVTTEGVVAFYDPATQTGIRPLTAAPTGNQAAKEARP